MELIFGSLAQAYWAKGLSVMPLRVMDKRPFLDNWQRFKDALPTPEEQEAWLKMYGPNNVGLVLGRQSNLTMVDIDTTDEKVEAAIMKCLPPSSWKRVGAKGCVLAFKWNGKRTWKILDKNQRTVVEILSEGSQVVIPPSIHPQTGKPYQANCDLLGVIDDLLPLPDDLEERLRGELSLHIELDDKAKSKFRVTEFIPLGARDSKMTEFAGTLSYAIFRGDTTLKQALGSMKVWVEKFVQDIDGDPLDVNKGLMKIIEFLARDVNTKGRVLPPGWDEGLSEEDKKAFGLDFSDEQQEWTYDQIEKHLENTFVAHETNDPKIYQTIQFVLQKMAKSVHLNEMDKDRVLHMIRKNLKDGVNINTYRRQLKELEKGPIEGANHTEIAEAVREEFESKNGKLAYYQTRLWRWNGSHWEEIEEQRLREIIALQYGGMAASKKAHDHKGIIDVLKNLLPQKLKTVDVDGVNFANGFLTAEMKVIPHDPQYGMTYTLPFRYMPNEAGKFPMFDKYMEDSWGGDEDYAAKRKALQEAISVTLFGKGPSFQQAVLLYGAANSGKSVLMNIIGNLVPDTARSAVSPEGWHDKFMVSEIAGKLLNVAGELDKDRLIDGTMFKQIIVGDEMTGQFKNKPLFKFRAQAMHWFASNFLPRTKDVSHGFNRRWLILHFPRPVAADKRIIDFDKMIIQQEIEAIVAWALEAFPDLMTRGHYTIPTSHNRHLNDMALQNSPIRQWLKDRLEFVDGARVEEADLFRDYWNYSLAELGGKRAGTPKGFSLDLASFLGETGRYKQEVVGEKVFILNVKLKDRARKT